MAGYSQDLRERVIRLRSSGETLKRIAEILDISVSSAKRYLKRYQETGSVAPTVARRMAPLLGSAELVMIEGQLQAHNDWTLRQHVALFAEQTGRVVSVSTFGRAVARLGWTRKKRQWVPKSGTPRRGTPSPSC